MGKEVLENWLPDWKKVKWVGDKVAEVVWTLSLGTKLVNYLVKHIGDPGPDGYDIECFYGKTPEYKRAIEIRNKRESKRIAAKMRREEKIKPVPGLDMELVEYLVENIGKPGPVGYDIYCYYHDTPEYEYAIKIRSKI